MARHTSSRQSGSHKRFVRTVTGATGIKIGAMNMQDKTRGEETIDFGCDGQSQLVYRDASYDWQSYSDKL